MKCPVCEQFGRDLDFQKRSDLDRHAHRFHGLSVEQLALSTTVEYQKEDEHPVPFRARKIIQ